MVFLERLPTHCSSDSSKKRKNWLYFYLSDEIEIYKIESHICIETEYKCVV